MSATRGILLSLLTAALAGCSDSAGTGDGQFRVVGVSPAPLAADVTPGAPVVVSFSHPVMLSSVNDTSIQLMRDGDAAAARVVISNDRRTVTLSGVMGNNQFFTLLVQTTVQDEAGSFLVAPVVAAFSTARADTSRADPRADTFGSDSTAANDILSLHASQEHSAIVIRIVFSGPVSLSNSGRSDALGGYIDIDADQNPSTGAAPLTDYFGPGSFTGRAGMGDEYVLMLWALPGDSVQLVDAMSLGLVGKVKLQISDSTATIRIPLALLGHDDGNVNIAAIVGNMFEATDVVPNAGHISLGTAGAAMSGSSLIAAPRAMRAVPRWGH